MRKTNVSVLFALAVLAVVPAFPQKQGDFAERVNKNRYSLSFADGRLSGDGVPVLQSAVAGAQFVLLGEDHGIAQIPAFAAALCDMTGAAGFHTMAVETGPLAAEELEKWIAQKDGAAALNAFDRDYPESIAFYNWAEEYDLLSHCAHSAGGGAFHLWGLDQELMGSSRILLTRILEQHPGAEAAKAAQRLLQKDGEAHAVAAKSGNPAETFMMTVPDADLIQFKELIQREGNPKARELLAALMESREIYQKYMDGRGFESNRQRGQLMKTAFVRQFHGAARADGSSPKILFKFGGEHMFKGFNPLRNNDIGNLVAELADAERFKSLHILILGVKGSQLRFAGIGHRFQAGEFNLAEDKDSDFLYLKPMFDRVFPEGLTMFDLREFRPKFASLGPVDREMERLIFGYDLLVLIPQARASRALQ